MRYFVIARHRKEIDKDYLNEQLKNKEENLKYDVMGPFFKELLNDPKKGVETLKGLQELSKMFPNNN